MKMGPVKAFVLIPRLGVWRKVKTCPAFRV